MSIRPSDIDILYGRQPVAEVLRSGRRGVRVVLLRGGLRDTPEVGEILDLARRRNVRVEPVDLPRLDQLTGGGHHQGIAIEAARYPYASFDDIVGAVDASPGSSIVLVLDHIEDPQNLGSLLRTADAAGVCGVVLPDRRAAEVTPTVVRVSAGASEHLRVARVVNLVRAMETLKEHGLWFAGLEAVPEAKSYSEADLTGPTGLVVGSEGQGLGRLVRERCDFLIRIPLGGSVTSLNAGVAGGVALFEIRRQQSRPKAPKQTSSKA